MPSNLQKEEKQLQNIYALGMQNIQTFVAFFTTYTQQLSQF